MRAEIRFFVDNDDGSRVVPLVIECSGWNMNENTLRVYNEEAKIIYSALSSRILDIREFKEEQ